jgi:hypothetical protein
MAKPYLRFWSTILGAGVVGASLLTTQVHQFVFKGLLVSFVPHRPASPKWAFFGASCSRDSCTIALAASCLCPAPFVVPP